MTKTELFGSARTSRAAKPVRLGDRGAVAVEFAMLFPVLLLMLVGIFGIGVVMIEDMRLTFVVQGAAQQAAAHPGTGVAWAQPLLPSATFFDTSTPQLAQISGQWPINLGVLNMFPPITLSTTASWPITPAVQAP
jgi:Flp pilus assembly protein TadG